ncbi:MAG TPA: 50S ribosomal protein L11 methyltransferase, partial [Chthoniobacterales bacterium]|nr:50S ribosomal protein L11 methyltransferase [Chthoniobacterales bacterium]
MYLWRKHVTNDWLGEHANALIARHGGALAIVERPGKRAIVEVVFTTRKATTELHRAFGGRIENLSADRLRRMAKQALSPPLRIGSRLLVSRTARKNAIVIPAEAAFGTGEHATTAMCLRMLERITREREDWTLLDA